MTPWLQPWHGEWAEVGFDGDTEKFLRGGGWQECQEELDGGKTRAEATEQAPGPPGDCRPLLTPGDHQGLSPLRSLQTSERPLSADFQPWLSLTRGVSSYLPSHPHTHTHPRAAQRSLGPRQSGDHSLPGRIAPPSEAGHTCPSPSPGPGLPGDSLASSGVSTCPSLTGGHPSTGRPIRSLPSAKFLGYQALKNWALV